MAAVMKLHGLPMSTCTTRVLTCLHEKGVDFELVPVNLFTAEHKHPPFLAKNPFGQIPVLEDGELTLFESRAISTYIAEKYKDSGTDLLGINQNPKKEETAAVSATAAAIVRVWVEVESHQYNPAISPIIYQHFVSPLQGNEPDQAIIDAHLEKLSKVLDVYEAKLGLTKYLAGDFFSLADLHHLPFTFYFMKTPWASLINDHPRVKAWWDDISSRSSFEKVSKGMTFSSDNGAEK